DAQAAKNNITGSGGASPDIAFGDTPLQLDEVRQTRERLIQMANVRYSGSTDLSSTTLGTLENPQITYVNDSLRLSGGVTGYGVLIVDKDLVITGNVNFYGIVIVGVCPTCPGRVEQGAGNFNLYGSLLVANTTSEHSDEARIKVTGNGDFFYSSSAINNALSATFATERWREVL
ncbi:MAG: hypothetical protein HYY96_11900, partial [Candidatus Tectomicrobia bacterium]|nr:hypothetical protein [Candidatus Tectomicrobia bacterium]